jgi:imidazolonepropionase-like amidohydrolase
MTLLKRSIHVLAILGLLAISRGAGAAGSSASSTVVLFQDVSVFDGRSDKLRAHLNVLVRQNRIVSISSQLPILDDEAPLMTIVGGNRVLMPGLIDAHWHSMLVAASAEQVVYGDPSLTTLIAARESEATLMRGFTSVRDMAGAVFGLKSAIDQGVVSGPRIWPSGAIISQTAGHGDFRAEVETGANTSPNTAQFARVGHGVIADGTGEVLRAAREQLLHGASQLKVAAGGGVVSHYDQIDVSEYSVEELRAAVTAATAWNTYVSVHAFTTRSVRNAIEAGVKCIEHGHLMDEPTAQLMARDNVWLSMQPFVSDDIASEPEAYREKLAMVSHGTDSVYKLAKKYRLKTAFGTDIMFSPSGGKDQSRLLVLMQRWYTPAEVLKMATSDNAELLALSGPRSPYTGRLGVIEEGALAALLLVDGNPLEHLELLADPQRNLRVIMKDGRVFKNTL